MIAGQTRIRSRSREGLPTDRVPRITYEKVSSGRRHHCRRLSYTVRRPRLSLVKTLRTYNAIRVSQSQPAVTVNTPGHLNSNKMLIFRIIIFFIHKRGGGGRVRRGSPEVARSPVRPRRFDSKFRHLLVRVSLVQTAQPIRW